MNSITPYLENTLKHPHKMAVCDIHRGVFSFADLMLISEKTQKICQHYKLTMHDSVLVVVPPSPELYGILCGLVGLGIRVLFIEPWLGIAKINHIIATVKPKAFISSTVGKFWGMRSAQIKTIPHWISVKEILTTKNVMPYKIEAVPAEHHAYLVFSSGTTGAPKGMIRTHGFMTGIGELFESLEPQDFASPDLVLFPNVTLFHLGTGRGAIIVPSKWDRKNLLKVFELTSCYKPQTLSLNPAFLKTIMDNDFHLHLQSVERIVVGGALSDCQLLQEAFAKMPETRFLHLYGGSEAEPISFIDGRIALQMSLEQNYFQTLCLGNPIPQIKHKIKDEILWVAGPNVAGEYIGDESQNKGVKERDAQGILWHCMGDRVKEQANMLWYQGRQNQQSGDFLLEQKIYQLLGHSKCFLTRTESQDLILVGENLNNKKILLQHNFPEISHLLEHNIIRDKRHRSRINRELSLPKTMRKLK